MTTGFNESNHPRPELFEAATGVSRAESWFNARSGTPRLLSLGIHAALVGLALIPWTSALPARPRLSETTVVLYSPNDVVFKPVLLPARQGGGGGGGKRQPTPASRGELPRGAD